VSGSPGRRTITARHVVLVASAAVVFVLGLQVLSTYVPGLGDLFELWPLLIVGLVVVTALVLYRALRPAR
jgi:hypothetical protein